MKRLSIGMKISKIRKKEGLTQLELADKTGLHVTTIGKIEAGMRTPTLETRKKLAKVLKVDITELFD